MKEGGELRGRKRQDLGADAGVRGFVQDGGKDGWLGGCGERPAFGVRSRDCFTICLRIKQEHKGSFRVYRNV